MSKNTDKDINIRKRLFEVVREIPYRIDIVGKDATCLAKNKLLGELLFRIGLKCRMVKAQSYWKDTPHIPSNLLALAPHAKFSHMFLEVFIPEIKKWVQVDATWDSKLAPTLPIAKWDGIHSTILACKIMNSKRVGNPSNYPYRDFDPSDPFTKHLNTWYNSLRDRK